MFLCYYSWLTQNSSAKNQNSSVCGACLISAPIVLFVSASSTETYHSHYYKYIYCTARCTAAVICHRYASIFFLWSTQRRFRIDHRLSVLYLITLLRVNQREVVEDFEISSGVSMPRQTTLFIGRKGQTTVGIKRHYYCMSWLYY